MTETHKTIMLSLRGDRWRREGDRIIVSYTDEEMKIAAALADQITGEGTECGPSD